MIRLVSFDLWGTLIAAPPRLPELLAGYLAEQTELGHSEIHDRIRAVGQRFDRCAIRSGRDASSSEKLLQLAREVGIPAPRISDLQREVKRHLDVAPPYLIEPTECKGLWTWLRSRGIEIAFASNSGFIAGKLMRGVLASLDLHDNASRCVFSDELGFAKPSAEFFRAVAGDHDPAAVLHLGDNAESDVAGAMDVGMFALHYVRNGKLVDRVKQIGSIAVLSRRIDAMWAHPRPGGGNES